MEKKDIVFIRSGVKYVINPEELNPQNLRLLELIKNKQLKGSKLDEALTELINAPKTPQALFVPVKPQEPIENVQPVESTKTIHFTKTKLKELVRKLVPKHLRPAGWYQQDVQFMMDMLQPYMNS